MKKLLAIQSELKAPKSQQNTFGKYKYRSCEDILEALKPLLKLHGCVLTLSDSIEMVGNRFYVKATAMFSDNAQDGPTATTTAYAREEEDKKGMDGSQITGAASSYARKYALNGLFCIDDTKDSDATNTHDEKPKKTIAKPPLAGEATPEQLAEIKQLAEDLGQPVQKIYDSATAGQVPNRAQALQLIPALKTKLSKKLDSQSAV